MFGNFGQLAELMKNFQNIRQSVQKMKTELAALEFSAQSPCGQVEVFLTGDMTVKKVFIQSALLQTADSEAIAEAVAAAVNSGLAQAKAEAAKRLSAAAGGLDIAGLM